MSHIPSKVHTRLQRLTVSALCLALCLVLPFLTGQIPQIGGMLSPMHIPVYLCGFLCGPWWAGAVGLIAPLLRNLLFHMPPILTAVAMTFELAAYGIAAGLFWHLFRRLAGGKFWVIYPALLCSMLCGRVVWGLVRWILAAAGATEFSFAAFLSGAFVSAWPGILLHLVIVPPLVRAVYGRMD